VNQFYEATGFLSPCSAPANQLERPRGFEKRGLVPSIRPSKLTNGKLDWLSSIQWVQGDKEGLSLPGRQGMEALASGFRALVLVLVSAAPSVGRSIDVVHEPLTFSR